MRPIFSKSFTREVQDKDMATHTTTADSHVSLVRQLRQALSCPAVKLCLREHFDNAKARKLLRAPSSILCDDHRRKLKRFLSRAQRDHTDGRWYVDTMYDFSTRKGPACKDHGLGRVYGDFTVGVLPSSVRNYIVTDVLDVDVANSHPTMLLHVCVEMGITSYATHLRRYVEHRGSVLESLKDDYGLGSYEAQKEAVAAVLNGGKPPAAVSETGAHFLHKLRDEAELIGNKLMGMPRFAEQATLAKKMKGRVSFLHFVMTHKELEVLIEIAAAFFRRGHTVRTLQYDGVHVAKPLTGVIDDEVLRQVQADVLAATNCSIQLKIKDMPSCFTEQLADAPDGEQLVDDDFAAEHFVKAYGSDLFIFSEGTTYIFDKRTGMWTDSERAMLAAVHAHKEQLVFFVGADCIANYGGDLVRVRKLISMIPNHIEEDDTFFMTSLDTSTCNLLYQDGIYDFNTDTFTEGFDPKVVFTGRINRPFNRNLDPAIKKEVEKMLFEDPYTQQQIKDGVPLFEKVAYARALAGDYMARKFYILVGSTGTGKGVRTLALRRSCGSYAAEFNINNFVYNPNNGADEAKQLSWMMKLVDKRLALSNEARSQVSLCGVLLKQFVSGGDTLTLRCNHQNEQERVNRATLFMFCNDVPTIQPCDDAVLDRAGGVIEMQVQFTAQPNPFRPDFEKPMVKDVKQKFNSPEYQDATVSLLLDAYKQYRIANQVHHTPPCVTTAIKKWVAGDGLESLLQLEFDTYLDGQGRADPTKCVAFDELDQVLRLEGVVPERKKVLMTKTKLAHELTRLGYVTDTRRLLGRGQKAQKVRCGLQRKAADMPQYFHPSDSDF